MLMIHEGQCHWIMELTDGSLPLCAEKHVFVNTVFQMGFSRSMCVQSHKVLQLDPQGCHTSHVCQVWLFTAWMKRLSETSKQSPWCPSNMQNWRSNKSQKFNYCSITMGKTPQAWWQKFSGTQNAEVASSQMNHCCSLGCALGWWNTTHAIMSQSAAWSSSRTDHSIHPLLLPITMSSLSPPLSSHAEAHPTKFFALSQSQWDSLSCKPRASIWEEPFWS